MAVAQPVGSARFAGQGASQPLAAGRKADSEGKGEVCCVDDRGKKRF